MEVQQLLVLRLTVCAGVRSEIVDPDVLHVCACFCVCSCSVRLASAAHEWRERQRICSDVSSTLLARSPCVTLALKQDGVSNLCVCVMLRCLRVCLVWWWWWWWCVSTMVLLFVLLLLSLRRQVLSGGGSVAAQRERERQRALEQQGRMLSGAAEHADGADGGSCGSQGPQHRRQHRDDDDAAL